MSKYLNTVTRLPNEAPTIEGRLAEIMEKAEVVVDEYHLSDTDRAKVVGALRGVAEDKLASYLTQENSVLHERVRKLEASSEAATWRVGVLENRIRLAMDCLASEFIDEAVMELDRALNDPDLQFTGAKGA